MRTALRSTSARPHLSPLLGALAGVLFGALLVALANAPASRSDGREAMPRESTIEVTHVPPLLTSAGEAVELAYDAYCLPGRESDEDAPCTAAGSVHARPTGRGSYVEVPLRRDHSNRLVATVPERIARSPYGFEYYAVIADLTTGAEATLPAGGPASPQRSISLGTPIEVDLGSHRFGAVRAGDRVVSAAWGDRPLDVGLEGGRNVPPIGGASFDVAADGTVYVLDEAHRRALRWTPGQSRPVAIPLDIDGTIADLALGPDRLYVLETAGGRDRDGVVRGFTLNGRAVETVRLPERAYRVRIGPDRAPVVLSQGSSQWIRAGSGATRSVRPHSGRSGRPLADGREVVVLRTGNEIRVALLSPNGHPRTWRIRSTTPVAEVQLAEPLGNRLVLVARVYTDAHDEFVVLVLGPSGVVERFSLASRDWAETAPLSRFRLAGPSLYQLGSTPEGLSVDRYDLEVK